LAQIQEQIDAARFDEADSAVQAALASGELERRELSRVYLLSGMIASARRDEAAARASFRRALVLDPDVALPPSAGPHVAVAFDQARSELGAERGLAVIASGSQAQAGGPARIRIRLVRDPEQLARRVRIQAGSFRAERPLPPLDHELEVTPPADGCSDVAAQVLDRAGNRLWSEPVVARVCARAPTAPVAAPPATATAPERPIGAPVWIGLALTGAGVAATSVLGVIALDRRSDYHDANSDPSVREAERRELFDSAQSAQGRATIAAVATGVIGAATITLYLLRPEARGPEIGVRAAPEGASAVVGGRF
jgi:hypothetical protein